MDRAKKLEVVSEMYGKSKKLTDLLKGYHDDINRNEIKEADGDLEELVGEIITDLDILTQDLWFECDDEYEDEE